ncbi:hypothetical protein BA011_29880 (plasmid) [Rhizobium leguminosarum]|uniref:Uncharacterized protein n=1 Tax=Rhizobium leguminosarum TaxID=384 RepID=A0A1B1CJF5_RHILE|nr:hypothetical protein BA011_29880 [Rhizobium leguminosarum]
MQACLTSFFIVEELQCSVVSAPAHPFTEMQAPMFCSPQLLPRFEMNPSAPRHANADDLSSAKGAGMVVAVAL